MSREICYHSDHAELVTQNTAIAVILGNFHVTFNFGQTSVDVQFVTFIYAPFTCLQLDFQQLKLLSHDAGTF